MIKDKIKNQIGKYSQTRKSAINLLAYIYLGALIVAIIVYGPAPLFYLLFAVVATLFILPNHYFLGFCLLITLTMLFERFFTLTGLVIDRDVYKFYLLDIVIVLSFAALAVRHFILQKKRQLIWGWPETILACFMLLVAIYLFRSLFDINAKFEVAFSSFKNYFFYPLLYFFTVLVVQSPKRLKQVSQLIMLNGVFLIAFLLIGFVRGAGLWTEFTPLSTAGVRYLAGTHAFYLLIAIMIGVPLLAFNRLRNQGLGLLVFALWSLGVTVSLMRHLWLAAVIGIAALFILMPYQNKKFISRQAVKAGLLVVSLALVAILAANLAYFNPATETAADNVRHVSERLLSLGNLSEDTSASWRLDLWNDARQVWQANPVGGIGFGHTILIDIGDYQNFEEIRNIHNSPLAIMVQMGLAGLIVFVLFIVAVFSSAWRPVYANFDLIPYYLGIAVAALIFLFASCFQPYLETNLMGIWFWILLGLLRSAAIINKPFKHSEQTVTAK
ncbi:MAG: O-antigen ligase family protein [Patescibacteria group bacterium]|jgi:O-antigen ligase